MIKLTEILQEIEIEKQYHLTEKGRSLINDINIMIDISRKWRLGLSDTINDVDEGIDAYKLEEMMGFRNKNSLFKREIENNLRKVFDNEDEIKDWMESIMPDLIKNKYIK